MERGTLTFCIAQADLILNILLLYSPEYSVCSYVARIFSYSISDTLTKDLRLDHLYMTDIYFLQFWTLRSPHKVPIDLGYSHIVEVTKTVFLLLCHSGGTKGIKNI